RQHDLSTIAFTLILLFCSDLDDPTCLALCAFNSYGYANIPAKDDTEDKNVSDLKTV
ncbi:hypothetical protein HN51_066067, partial [Arachis hypogaea]